LWFKKNKKAIFFQQVAQVQKQFAQI